MSYNKNLHKAKRKKDDEFYTKYEDIEKEMKHYKEQLKDKIIYLPADKPYISEFWNFFYNNFEEYKLKELWASYLDDDAKIYKYNGEEIRSEELEGDGDVLGDEVRNKMKEVDIVITNPPFSTFRIFVDNLMSDGVDFLIIGNLLAVNYKSIIDRIIEDKIRSGYNAVSEFVNPDGEIKSVPTRWYTTLEIDEDYKEKMRKIKYYPFDNYDAINVDRLENIPDYYMGKMGVPITFLHEISKTRKEYEIIGVKKKDSKYSIECVKKYKNVKFYKDGECTNFLEYYTPSEFVVIYEEEPKRGRYFTVEGIDGYFVEKFERVIIQRKERDDMNE